MTLQEVCPEYFIRILGGGNLWDPEEGWGDYDTAVENLARGKYLPDYINGKPMIWATKLTPMLDGSFLQEDFLEELAGLVREYCNEYDIEDYPEWTDPYGTHRREYEEELAGEKDPYVNPALKHPDAR